MKINLVLLRNNSEDGRKESFHSLVNIGERFLFMGNYYIAIRPFDKMSKMPCERGSGRSVVGLIDGAESENDKHLRTQTKDLRDNTKFSFRYYESSTFCGLY